MDYTRTEIMPGVWLNHLKTDKFKTACMSVSLLAQLSRDTASLNALIPFVLRRGTTRYDTMDKLTARLDELYGAAIEPVVRRIGEIQSIGLYASVPEEDFLPGNEKVLADVCDLMGQMLLSPATRGGLLMSDYVNSEREKLCELIRSSVNDKHSYAVKRCIEAMCCYEDFSVGRYGSEDAVEAIRYQKLSKHYKNLLQTSPVELFYVGRAEANRVEEYMRDAFAAMPRGELDYDIGTDVRLNAVEDHIRYVTEEMDVTQGRLVMGFRLGECMENYDLAPIYVFNCVFGSGTTSKLFMNVRERLQLCYYASSAVEIHKGLMFAFAGIEFDKFDRVKDEILAQLENVKNGEISEEELQSAKAGVASDLKALMDNQGDLEGFYLSNALDGRDYSPEELSEMAEMVTKEQVIEVAQGIECDLIYFLKGWEEEEAEESTESDDNDAM